jgi:hypothetical protein
MALEDDYDLAANRWFSAMMHWTNKNCPSSGHEYDKMIRYDETLQRLAIECINKESRDQNEL